MTPVDAPPIDRVTRALSDAERVRAHAGPPPVTRSALPTLILTVGLPATGKSTFCRRLAAETGAIILESDALRRLLFARPTHRRPESRRLFDAIHTVAEELLAAGVSVIIDSTCPLRSDREPAYELARRSGARLHVLLFETPLAIIEERLARRQRGLDVNDRSAAGLRVYHQMARQFEPLETEHQRIDTSDALSIEAALKEIAAAMRAATVAGTRGGAR
jgi:predicted kinase